MRSVNEVVGEGDKSGEAEYQMDSSNVGTFS